MMDKACSWWVLAFSGQKEWGGDERRGEVEGIRGECHAIQNIVRYGRTLAFPLNKMGRSWKVLIRGTWSNLGLTGSPWLLCWNYICVFGTWRLGRYLSPIRTCVPSLQDFLLVLMLVYCKFIDPCSFHTCSFLWKSCLLLHPVSLLMYLNSVIPL